MVICNRRFVDLYRLDPDRMKPGVSWREIIEMRAAAGTSPMSVSSNISPSASRCARGERAHEWCDTLPDGRTIQLRRQAMAGGGWISLHEDVTALRDQRAVFDERVSLQTLIDCLHDNLWVKDVESRFVICNKVTATRMGFSEPGEVIGKNDLELLPGEIEHKFFDDEQKSHRQRPADDGPRGTRLRRRGR